MEWRTDKRLNRGTKEYLKVLNKEGSTPIEQLSKEEARKVLDDLQGPVVHRCPRETHTIETRLGNTVTFYHIKHPDHTPTGAVEGYVANDPTFLFLHGGGWILGSTDDHLRLVEDIVLESGWGCISIDYTRAPEAKFPTQLNEINAVIKVILAGEIDGVDIKNLAIIGNSAGGNMAISTCINNPDVFKLAVLMWPVTDASTGYESYRDFGKDRFLTANEMNWMFHAYARDKKDFSSPLLSPIKLSNESLRKMPKTLMFMAENDILRDQGEEFYRKLDEAGGDVSGVRMLGVTHDWGLLNGFSNLPATKDLVLFTSAKLNTVWDMEV